MTKKPQRFTVKLLISKQLTQKLYTLLNAKSKLVWTKLSITLMIKVY